MFAALVFALSWLAYAWTAAPSFGWLDSAEFVAASAQLGIAHPPGHPLPALLGRALMMIPAGDGAWRVNLASSLAGALAALALYALVAEVTRRRLIAAAAALGFAFSGAAWGQSVRAEVYALEAALVLAALAFAARFISTGDRRSLYAAALATGLALANHHFVTLLFFVPTAAVALARRPGAAAAGRAAALGVLGLAAFLYLPARALHDPEVMWGDPQRLSSFVWTISAKAFQKSLGGPPEPLSGQAGDVVTALVDQVSLPVAALALLGAYLLVRARRTRGLGVLLAGVAVTGAAGRALLGFDFDNPDAFGYLLPAQAALVALAAAGLSGAVDVVRHRSAAVVAAALAAAYPNVQAVRFAADTSLRHDHGGETWARALLDDLPSRTLLITSYYETAFQMWALRAVENDRPDVDLLDRNLLTQPYASAAAARRRPDLAGLILAPLRGGAPSPLALLDGEARRRPVAFELAGNLDAVDPALPRLVPWGPIALYLATPPDRAGAEAVDRARSAAVARAVLGGAQDRHGAQRVLAWNAYLDARFYCALDRRQAAQDAVARARAAGASEDDLRDACPP